MVGEPNTLLVFLAGLSLILVTAHSLGIVADRLGFAPVVGELLTGIILGPTILGVFLPSLTSLVVPIPEGVAALASLGLIFLLVLAGIEVDVPTVRRYIRPTIALAMGASFIPFLLGFGVAWVLPADVLVTPESRLHFALFLATALSISAVPVAVRVLIDLEAMNSRVGQLTVTTAVIIDAAGWIALTVISNIARKNSFDLLYLSQTVVTLASFVALVLFFGPRLTTPLFGLAARARSPVLTGFSLVIVSGLVLAGASTALGLEAVLGAFLAGIIVRNRLDEEASRVFQIVTLGVFAPLFFSTAGLQADLSVLLTPSAVAVALLIFGVAVAGKFLGVAVGAVFTDLSRDEALCLAIGLNARGAMEIVVAAVGLSIGILTPTVYAIIVLVAIVTSVLTPPLLRRALVRVPQNSRYEPTA